eukprot:Gb_36653 [translate_table: standard]
MLCNAMEGNAPSSSIEHLCQCGFPHQVPHLQYTLGHGLAFMLTPSEHLNGVTWTVSSQLTPPLHIYWTGNHVNGHFNFVHLSSSMASWVEYDGMQKHLLRRLLSLGNIEISDMLEESHNVLVWGSGIMFP